MENFYKILSTSVLTVLCLVVVVTTYAQPPMTVRAFVSAGATANNTYVAVGQPFFEQIYGNGYEIAYGVAQSQLDIIHLEDETCKNEDYSDYGFDIPADELSEGIAHFEEYSHNVYDIFGYDRLSKLDLSVWPVYEVEVSETYSGALPFIDGSKLKDGIDYQVVEGENNIVFFTVHGCDSVVKLYALSCPYIVKDADSNAYNTVMIDNYCWTQSNLKTTHYFGDSHVEVPNALIYSPGEEVNEDIYGRLYTWYSAVNIPEGSSTAPSLDDKGFVRGICPAGWHIPATPEITALESHSPYELHSPNLWIGGAGANTTGFTLLPAGFYNASTGRFERLRLEERFWNTSSSSSSSSTTTYEISTCCTAYHCDTFIKGLTTNAADAYSVRCVKNY